MAATGASSSPLILVCLKDVVGWMYYMVEIIIKNNNKKRQDGNMTSGELPSRGAFICGKDCDEFINKCRIMVIHMQIPAFPTAQPEHYGFGMDILAREPNLRKLQIPVQGPSLRGW